MREGSSDDFQAAPSCVEKGGSNNAKYKWDHATEDRLCDLYEQYLEVSHLSLIYCK
jgi:ubinuclein